jgi:dihydrolipoamide dehydrogenase
MKEIERDLVVLGGGPGGYTAAFRAADLGRSVTLIEKESTLGGVCLNVGCIPSKTLLHISEVMHDVEDLSSLGVSYDAPKVDIASIHKHKQSVVKGLTDGLDGLCKARKVERITGIGSFISDSVLEVQTESETMQVSFKDLILAVGSRPVQIPHIPYEDERVWDSSKALELTEIPKRLVIIGGGIIGLEMAAIYNGFGSKITIVEMTDSIIPPADRDLKQPLLKHIKKQYEAVYTSTKVTGVSTKKSGLTVSLEGKKAPESVEADVVLVAVGRKANTDQMSIEKTSIELNERGWIKTDEKQRTSVPHIFAIGDATGDPMLAHKASHQGKIAAEVACDQSSAFTPMGIPSVAYTQPEIAWVGLTEQEAKEQDIPYKKGSFPWQASGRAMSSLATSGVSKALFDSETGRLLGAGIAGKHAGELLSEAILALELGAVAQDIALTIHPHPTLSETFALAAELAEGTATDTMNR